MLTSAKHGVKVRVSGCSLLRQLGVYRAENIEVFFDAARSSVIGTLPANDREAMVTGRFLDDPSLLDQFIELAATDGDYGSLVRFQGSIGRYPALMEANFTSWIERKRANPEMHFAVSGFCTPDYTRDLEAAGTPVYEETTRATHAIAALAGFARSFRERRLRSAVPDHVSLPTGFVNELAAARVPTVPARTVFEAGEAAADLGFSVVLKVLSADTLHKNDIRTVRLGISDRAAAEVALNNP